MANGTGANMVDTITGFRGLDRRERRRGRGAVRVHCRERLAVAKSIIAQAVFDAKFLLPSAPASPEFFLIPGNNSVTVMWQPSSTETGAGDPFSRSRAHRCVTACRTPSTIRTIVQYDVEGYRVYRGRVDTPNELTLLAQFDYAGTVINDYTGTINTDMTARQNSRITTSCPGLGGKRQGRHRIVATVTPNQFR